MKKTTGFWDSSALVPLCVQEAATRQVLSYLELFRSWFGGGAWWRLHSAVCRLPREGKIAEAEKRGAAARLRLLRRGWREVLPDEAVRDLALRVLDRYSLRAADSLQLAASLIWCGQRPSGRSFICGDHRSAEAADAAGFSVLELVPKSS